MKNSPISWFGGKRLLRKQIIEKFPCHTCYVEVFGGAGWVLFGKEPSKVEVYNDIDSENSYWIMLNSWEIEGTDRNNGLLFVNMDMEYSCYYPYGTFQIQSFYWQTLDVDFNLVLTGDMNGDGDLNSADARYLMMHMMGAPGYETLHSGDGDVNNDGSLNSADARYLMMHMMGHPDYTPLYP